MQCPNKYTTLSDKHALVELVSFDNTCTGLLNLLYRLSGEEYLFRGQRDALWPIVSTGQRTYTEFIKNDSSPKIGFLDFLCRALDYAKVESEFVPKKGTGTRRNYYDHEIWGWLQHYSYPTPYIDFTRDWRVALYMATAHIEDSTERGYFSIYAISGKYEINGNENIRLEKLIRDNAAVLTKCKLSKEQMFSFNTWKDFSFCLIHKDGSLKPWSKDIAKERVASQDGLFVYLKDDQMSLEAYLARQSKIHEGKDGIGCILPKIKCLEVPNSMAPLVKAFCKRNGYTAESLGLADQSTDDCMKCIKRRFLEAI